MTWVGTSQPYSDVYCKPLPLVGKTTAGASANLMKWAKTAYITAGSWINARYGENGVVGRSMQKDLPIRDAIPTYKLPW